MLTTSLFYHQELLKTPARKKQSLEAFLKDNAGLTLSPEKNPYYIGRGWI